MQIAKSSKLYKHFHVSLSLSLSLETNVVLTEITLNDVARSDALTVSDVLMFDGQLSRLSADCIRIIDCMIQLLGKKEADKRGSMNRSAK